MTALAEKMRDAATKSGNKDIIQSVKRADRAEQQRQDHKAKLKAEGKKPKPKTTANHNLSDKDIAKAMSPAAKKVAASTTPAKKAAKPNGQAKLQAEKPKDTLTNRGTDKIAQTKQKPAQKPKGRNDTAHLQKSPANKARLEKSAAQVRESNKHLNKAKTALHKAEKELEQVAPIKVSKPQAPKPAAKKATPAPKAEKPQAPAEQGGGFMSELRQHLAKR